MYGRLRLVKNCNYAVLHTFCLQFVYLFVCDCFDVIFYLYICLFFSLSLSYFVNYFAAMNSVPLFFLYSYISAHIFIYFKVILKYNFKRIWSSSKNLFVLHSLTYSLTFFFIIHIFQNGVYITYFGRYKLYMCSYVNLFIFRLSANLNLFMSYTV